MATRSAVRRLTSALVLVATLCAAGSGHAHKVVLSLYVTGGLIEGEVGFSNGDVAPEARIDVYGPGGERLAELATDDSGFFAYQASARIDHIFKADLGAGHVAEARVAADELSPTLAAQAAPTGTTPAPDSQEGTAAAAGAASQVLTQANLQAAIQEVVASQVRPLRQQVTALENRIRFQDVLGGLGYIAGLMGLALYIQSRRRTKAGDQNATSSSEVDRQP